MRWQRAGIRAYREVMPARSTWAVVRGWPGDRVIVAVTGTPSRLRDLAHRLAGGGHFGFAALPAAFPDLFAMACFDVVVLLSDVARRDRARLAALHACDGRQDGTLVHLMPAYEVSVLDVIAHRLARAPVRRITEPCW
jgi:hypothetical protein